MEFEGRFIITGRPPTKKNSAMVTKYGKVLPSFAYRKWEPHAIEELRLQWQGKPAITRPVLLRVRYYMYNRQGWPDLLGLLQATCDVLEKAKVIINDRNVAAFTPDTCIMGVTMEDPRTEIEIYSLYRSDGYPLYNIEPNLIKRCQNGEFEDFKDVAEAYAKRKRKRKTVCDTQTSE